MIVWLLELMVVSALLARRGVFCDTAVKDQVFGDLRGTPNIE